MKLQLWAACVQVSSEGGNFVPLNHCFSIKLSKCIFARMRHNVRSNAGIIHKVLLLILDNIKQDLNGEDMDYGKYRSFLILKKCTWWFDIADL